MKPEQKPSWETWDKPSLYDVTVWLLVIVLVGIVIYAKLMAGDD